jgi:hypothetical protein
MWILILIVLAVVVYFVLSQSSSNNQASKSSSRTQASKASSQNYTNQVDYSNLEIISLDSSVSIHYNYSHLRDLLAEGKWKEADKETGRLMLAVGNLTVEKKIEDGEWTHADPDSNRLGMLHFFYFPCPDLCTIDRLWLKYSNGRFGFSVQKRIMSEIGEDSLSILLSALLERSGHTFEKRMEIRDTFEKRIGWYSPSSSKIYNDLTFSISAPYGHLPTTNYCREGSSYGPFETKPILGCHNLVYLLNRLSICGIAL